MVLFYDVTRRLLNQRWDLVKQGQTPTFTDIRHFFYECRNVFLRENPQLNEIDSTSKTPYVDWQNGALNHWSIKHCEAFSVPKELYWRVREKLNIWAEAKATCDGESGKFLIDHETRRRTAQGCSFILLCEKQTVSKELWGRLKAQGYKVNLVSTGGYSPSDVQEMIISISEELDGEDPTFYFLVLHDFDLDGVKIFFNLKERYGNVIDVGVNGELFKYLNGQGTFDLRLVEEQRLNKCLQTQLKSKIEENNSAYTLADFEYLQGVQQPDGKTWVGKRIEIDAIHVQYGIDPFIKYILQKIADECNVWDLTRIGLSDFSLDEPENPFQNTLDIFHQEISEKCNDTVTRLYKPLNRVREFVKDVTSLFLNEYAQVCTNEGIVSTDSTYEDGTWIYHVNREDVEKLKAKYQEGFTKKYVSDHKDDLDEINGQIENYEGDVTTAVDDLSDQHIELQEQVNHAAANDSDAQEFENALGEIYWGEEEFDKIAVPDEIQVTREVIRRLQEHLAELENNGHGTEAKQ
jgi:hypothetical protein